MRNFSNGFVRNVSDWPMDGYGSAQRCIACCLGILLISSLIPQKANGSDHTARIGLSQNLSTTETPFWLHANRDGRIPPNSARNFGLYGRYDRPLFQNSEVIDGGAGFRLDLLASDLETRLRFTELYAHLAIAGWQLHIGRFYDTIGLNPDHLTTGSMMMSRNAMQPFKIRLSTTGFRPVPLTGERLAFRARWSEGILTDTRFVENTRVHQKYLYLRLELVENVFITGGVAHNLMWGGRHPELGHVHRSFRDWLSDVLAQPDRRVFDNVSPVGNGLGAYEAGLEYRLPGSWRIGAHRMFFIDDKESLNLRSPRDGMWTVYFDRRGDDTSRLIEYIIYEHINTKNQDAGTGDAYGRARYYSHYVYRDGWVHHGQILGTPFFTIDPEKIGTDERILVNNIVLAHHLGFSGSIDSSLSYELVMTYSRNYGICNDQTSGGGCRGSAEDPVQQRDDYVPFHELRRDRYSTMVTLRFPVDRIPGLGPASIILSGKEGRSGSVHLSAAVDAGDFYEQVRLGFEVGLSMPLN